MKKLIVILFTIVSLNSLGQSSASDFLRLAIKYVDSGNFTTAITNCNKAVVMDSTMASAWYLRGFVKYKVDDFKGAINDLTATLERDEGFVEAFYYRGLAYNESGNYWRAYRDLQKAQDVIPHNTYALLIKGVLQNIFGTGGA
ncbi:MAG: hypothetical protein JEZ03_03385 [Bacteroidales bacterium]|nr:hypothetical protein [Bacteroidales bacterium]